MPSGFFCKKGFSGRQCPSNGVSLTAGKAILNQIQVIMPIAGEAVDTGSQADLDSMWGSGRHTCVWPCWTPLASELPKSALSLFTLILFQLPNLRAHLRVGSRESCLLIKQEARYGSCCVWQQRLANTQHMPALRPLAPWGSGLPWLHSRTWPRPTGRHQMPPRAGSHSVLVGRGWTKQANCSWTEGETDATCQEQGGRPALF